MILESSLPGGNPMAPNKGLCFNCLYSTEKTIREGNPDRIPFPARHWFDIHMAESDFLKKVLEEKKPRTTLEIGCGTGRLVETCLENCPGIEKLIAVEGAKEMAEFAEKRFRKEKKVKIIKMFVGGRTPFTDNCFDLGINAMNIVGWQEDEKKWLEEMLRCCKTVVFSVYKKGFEKQRREMYRSRGHTSLGETRQGHIILEGCSVCPAAVSKAYTRKEVEKLCKELTGKFRVRSICRLMFGCVLEK